MEEVDHSTKYSTALPEGTYWFFLFVCLFVFCLFFVFNRKWTVSCLMILSKIMEILVNCNYKENIRSIIQANNRGAKSLIEENLDELSWKVTVKVSHSCQTLLYNLIQINYQHT